MIFAGTFIVGGLEALGGMLIFVGILSLLFSNLD